MNIKKSILIIIGWLLSFSILGLSCWFLLSYCKVIIIGFLFASCIVPFVKFLNKHIKLLQYKHCATIITLFITGGFISILYLLINKLIIETSYLSNKLPYILKKIEEVILKIISEIPFINIKSLTQSDYVNKLIAGGVNSVIDIGKSIPNLFASIMFIVLFTLFFVIYYDTTINAIKKIIPSSLKEIISTKMSGIIGGYFKAQFQLFLIIWGVVLVGFRVLNVEEFVLLSLLVAIVDALPIFGAGTFLVPYAIWAFIMKDYNLMIGCLIIYLVTQGVRRLIEPKLLASSIGLNPFLSVICLYIGYQLFGVIGLLLGVPAGTVLYQLYINHFFDSLINAIKYIVTYLKNQQD